MRVFSAIAMLLAASVVCTAEWLPQINWDEAYSQADRKLKQLTLDEKKNFMLGHSEFFFYGVPGKGIPFLYLSDATQGVHIRRNLSDTTNVKQLEKSTAFPAPAMLAATFNTDLAGTYGRSVGEECRAGGIEILLGPGVNIAKNAQNGRNYEYFGEDPCLSGRMAAAYVRGLQSTGTAACLKHFIGNETEFYRRRANSIIDERALHEVYMAPFRAGIEAGAGYVMTSYNLVNGEWTAQSKYVVDTLLRQDLGFKGCVMSDWASVYDGKKIMRSGLNTVMPGWPYERKFLTDALASGEFSEVDIDAMIRPVLAAGYAFGFYDRPKYKPELLAKYPEHVEASYNTAKEGVVLLRNDGVLPVAADKKILVTGKYLDSDPRHNEYSEGSSGDVEGYDVVTLRQALKDKFGPNIDFAENPAAEQLKAADVVLAVVGTVDLESFERPFALSSDQENMVANCVDNNPNTVVMVMSGGGVRMSKWNDRAAGIMYIWYPGQMGARAVADILAGDVNPSGKLPMTIDRNFSDSPSSKIMPEGAQFYTHSYMAYNESLIRLYDVPYFDSVLVGHRWYEKNGLKPLYAFGHGLSYTTFELTDPKVTVDGDVIKVRLNVRNTGSRDGAEVVQVYVGEDSPTVVRPLKELKAFKKVAVPAGKTEKVEIVLNRGDLRFWDDRAHAWMLNPGSYTVYIGNASDNIVHTLAIKLKS
ncbi:MAG: glycoside hydrolase family 3 C-terminal domain-containing protein [Bacteroides sp.]|nr:glycoside hydrolase family 3 C-terminal domain-containing protein [Bacteroides sp.]MCM1094868.1 glycoside hydrolase family 3 C-terminal domain-containing protein [Terasakiella sp.]